MAYPFRTMTTRDRYTVGQKRSIINDLFKQRNSSDDFKTKEFIDQKQISKSMLSRWTKEYRLGWFAPELFDVNIDKAKYQSKSVRLIDNINRKLAQKFPEISKYVEVRQTEGMGYGLFATKNIPKHSSVLGGYEGESVILRNDRRTESDYVYGLLVKSKKELPAEFSEGAQGIDGAAFDSSFLRYMNHDIDNYNMLVKERKGKLVSFSRREITAGEQLFSNYGQQYWQGRYENLSTFDKTQGLYRYLAMAIQEEEEEEEEEEEVNHRKRKRVR